MFPSPREHSLTLHFQDVLSRCESLSHFQSFFRVGISSWNTVYNSYNARLVKDAFCQDRQDAPEVLFLLQEMSWRRLRVWRRFDEGVRLTQICYFSVPECSDFMCCESEFLGGSLKMQASLPSRLWILVLLGSHWSVDRISDLCGSRSVRISFE